MTDLKRFPAPPGMLTAGLCLAMERLGHAGSEWHYLETGGSGARLVYEDSSTILIAPDSFLCSRAAPDRRDAILVRCRALFAAQDSAKRLLTVSMVGVIARTTAATFTASIPRGGSGELVLTDGRVTIEQPPPFPDSPRRPVVRLLAPGQMATIESGSLEVTKLDAAEIDGKQAWAITVGACFWRSPR